MSKTKSKKRRDLRILWNSNAVFTNSGYAVETRDVLFRLIKDGWKIATIGFFGVEGYHVFLDGGDLIDKRFTGVKMKVYPKMGDPYGGDAMINHAMDYKANVVMCMQDIWTIGTNYLTELNKKNIPWIPWLPIDQDPPHQGVLNNLNLAYKILSYSRYGQKVLEDCGYASKLILEGTDTEIFKPMDKMKMREKFGISKDTFMFGMIGANKENPPRKGYQEALEAFSLFNKEHPNSAIYFHTQQIAPNGFPITEFARSLNIEKNVLFLDSYSSAFRFSSKEVAEEINCFDILLHPSQTEGFGLLIIESQSCGVPVIINRCHSQPELVLEGKTGEICETGKPWFRTLNAYVYPADVNSLHEKMEVLYKKMQDEKIRAKMKKNARDHVVKNYNVDIIVKEEWVKFFEDLQEELLPKP